MTRAPFKHKPRVVFFGTPDFAVQILEAIIDSQQYEIVGAVTETDKPAGRGQKLQAPPVKRSAAGHGIWTVQPAALKGITSVKEDGRPELQTENPKAEELVDFLNRLAPIDVFVIAAYGKLIPKALLNFPRCGMINVHASLLPRWRGAAPIHRALFEGDAKTGVCVMQTVPKLDAGGVFCRKELPITEHDTFGSLHDSLAALGEEALLEALPGILDGSLKAEPQPEEGITYADKWRKEDLIIRWDEPAKRTLRRIRACAPAPGARTSLNGSLVKIFSAHQHADQNYPSAAPGTVVEANKEELVVAAGSSQYIAVDELQLSGRKRLPAVDVLCGGAVKAGDFFTS